MENKRKRYSLAVLFAITFCFVSCVFNVHAEKYSPTDAGEVIIYKSFETGEARYINYTKNSNTETYGLSQDNYSYETDAYIPNSAATTSVIGDDGRLPATNTEVFPKQQYYTSLQNGRMAVPAEEQHLWLIKHKL